jgi:hypothetical protein
MSSSQQQQEQQPSSSSPALLREWSRATTPAATPAAAMIPAEDPPVAPAVVLPLRDNSNNNNNNNNSDNNDGKPAAIYPIATFVNLVRTGMDHIYARAEAIAEDATTAATSTTVAVTSIGSEAPAMQSIRRELRDTQSEGDLFLTNDDEYVLIDGDLVAIPPQDEDQYERDFEARQSTKNRMRRSMKGFRKWMKKRQGKKKDTAATVEKTNTRSDRKKQTSNRRGRSWRDAEHQQGEVSSQLQPTVVALPPLSTASVAAAHFIGNVALQNVASAVAFIESEDDFKGKTDKTEENHLDNMLQQARLEVELEHGLDDDIVSSLPPAKKPHAKQSSKEEPCALSNATTNDAVVFNDTLKVIMLGDLLHDKSHLARAIGGKKPKRPRNTFGVEVHTWTPEEGLTFTIWDVSSVSAGTHPATQALFFSAESLYILVWDLGASTCCMMAEDDDDDHDNEFLQEQLARKADRALEHDMQDRVLAWLDRMVPYGSAVLPVASVAGMDSHVIEKRCSMWQGVLMNHPAFKGDHAPNLIFGKNSILQVNLATGEGLPELQETVQAIGRERVFAHVGSQVKTTTMQVLETIRILKQDRKVILLDHLLSQMDEEMKMEDVADSLHFLSNIGEILYFGNSADETLSRYVILSRQWLVSALSCILRPDLQRELSEMRQFTNLQRVYSGEGFVESDIVQTLLKGTNSSCPILSTKDSAMLWQNMSFMKEAADRTAQLSEASTTMYDFLERLLVHFGILLRLNVAAEPTYFVPSLLDLAEPSDVWTYKTSDSWMTALCHSWLLRHGVPTAVMEHITTHLLQDLYEFSHTFQGQLARPLLHSKTVPIGFTSLTEFIADHDQEAIGRIKIHQVMCWKSSVLVKIGSVFADSDHQHELRESFTEIYVALVDDQSNHCVDTKSMNIGTKRLIVCGKGQIGRHGRKLWKGGYGLVLDSIKASLADFTGVDRQVVCYECLAHSHPSNASTWSWQSVQRAAQTGDAGVRCSRGHLCDTNLLCGAGMCPLSTTSKPAPPPLSPRVSKPVNSLLRSVVLVGLWDSRAGKILSVGSGFVADEKVGLIVTAGHILFQMSEGRKFGTPYFGLKHAKAVIGVIPDGGHTSVFRYFADIVAHDIHNVDACVLRITSRIAKDIEGEGEGCADQPDIPVSIPFGEVPALKMTRKFEMEESVRILGFNQGGEGVLEKGKHVNRSADFAKGYICKKFKAPIQSDDDNSETSSGSTKTFSPREEIVVMCPTISGHSGGPCVNEEGVVVGILSRADPGDRQRCYLVPVSELRTLVRIAKHANPIDLYSYE